MKLYYESIHDIIAYRGICGRARIGRFFPESFLKLQKRCSLIEEISTRLQERCPEWQIRIYRADELINNQARDTIQWFWMNNLSNSMPSATLSWRYQQALQLKQNMINMVNNYPDGEVQTKFGQAIRAYQQFREKQKVLADALGTFKAALREVDKSGDSIETKILSKFRLLKKSHIKVILFMARDDTNKLTPIASNLFDRYESALLMNYIEGIDSLGSYFYYLINEQGEFQYESEIMKQLFGKICGFLVYEPPNHQNDSIFLGLGHIQERKKDARHTRQFIGTCLIPPICRGYSLGEIFVFIASYLLRQYIDVLIFDSAVGNVAMQNAIAKVGFETYGTIPNQTFMPNPHNFKEIQSTDIYRQYWINPALSYGKNAQSSDLRFADLINEIESLGIIERTGL